MMFISAQVSDVINSPLVPLIINVSRGKGHMTENLIILLPLVH